MRTHASVNCDSTGAGNGLSPTRHPSTTGTNSEIVNRALRDKLFHSKYENIPWNTIIISIIWCYTRYKFKWFVDTEDRNDIRIHKRHSAPVHGVVNEFVTCFRRIIPDKVPSECHPGEALWNGKRECVTATGIMTCINIHFLPFPGIVSFRGNSNIKFNRLMKQNILSWITRCLIQFNQFKSSGFLHHRQFQFSLYTFWYFIFGLFRMFYSFWVAEHWFLRSTFVVLLVCFNKSVWLIYSFCTSWSNRIHNCDPQGMAPVMPYGVQCSLNTIGHVS